MAASITEEEIPFDWSDPGAIALYPEEAVEVLREFGFRDITVHKLRRLRSQSVGCPFGRDSRNRAIYPHNSDPLKSTILRWARERRGGLARSTAHEVALRRAQA